MAAWCRWGSACLEHLVGGFAFAVWTPARQELFAARDHAGERPLFYYRGKDFFALASMPKGLLAIPGISQEFNEPHIATWNAGLRQDERGSFFRSIERVSRGHFLRITPDSFECTQYWHPANAKPTRYKKDEEYAEAVVELLDRAVEARLRSPRPIGSFLSAGLDSSSVTASAALLLARQNRKLTAFTSVPRPEFNGLSQPGYLPCEGEGAAEVARLYPNIEHVLVDSKGYDLLPTMQTWIDALDEPLPNVTNLLWFTAIVDRARQRNVGVILDGADGNGTLSWYTWSILGYFFMRGRWLSLGRTTRALHSHGALSLKTAARYATRGLIPQWLTRLLISKKKLDGTYDRLVHPDWMVRHNIPNRIFDSIYHRPLNLVREQSQLFGIYDRAPFLAATQALTGVELRDPTADKRLYEFCFSIPPEQYVAGGHSRSLVRRAMKDRLPDSVRLRYTRGLQGADWYIPMTEALPELRKEVGLLDHSPAARQALDLPAMHALLDNWPQSGFHTFPVSRRWHFALIPAISLGYFLRSHEATPAPPTRPAVPVATPLH
jgi:asparagine synthase (glutamine-hydrolysing)